MKSNQKEEGNVSFFPSLADISQETDWIQRSLKETSEEAMQDVDFGLFEKNLMARIEADESFASSQQTTFWESIQNLFQLHPKWVLGTSFSLCVLVLFAIPFLEKSSSKKEEVIVEKVIQSKSSQVAVLKTKNQTTGKPMTVVIIEEDDFNERKEKKKKKEHHEPKGK